MTVVELVVVVAVDVPAVLVGDEDRAEDIGDEGSDSAGDVGKTVVVAVVAAVDHVGGMLQW